MPEWKKALEQQQLAVLQVPLSSFQKHFSIVPYESYQTKLHLNSKISNSFIPIQLTNKIE